MGPCKTCPHPQCEFLEFSAVSVWLCAGATIFRRSFEFCLVNSCFPLFVRVLFGEFEVPTVRLGFNR